MADLQTDDEKVEAIKKWWKANGVSVIAGIAIGLGSVFGWRAWINHQSSVSQQASLAFEQVLATAAVGANESAEKQAEILVDDYPGTPYAMFADLAAAKIRIEADDKAGAAAALESAIKRAPAPGLAKLAALRLARVLIDSGEQAKASALIDAHDDGGPFAADFAALRGDIAAAEGQLEAARTAYQEAIDGGAGNARLLELKLQDLRAGDAS
jgi:predicted negative regulator of RcsB-dependent stress response